MPDMDGLEATRIIRARERLTGRHVPIVALTANAMQGDRQRCLAAGMDSYMTKPMQPSQLVAAISEALAQGGAKAGSSGTGDFASSDEPARPAEEVPSSSSQSDAIDWQVAMDAAFNDEQLLVNLVNDFLEESPNFVTQIREAAARRDTDSAERAAHTLKGQFRIFGAHAAAAALQIERQLRKGETDIEVLLDALEEELQRVGSALRKRMQSQPKST